MEVGQQQEAADLHAELSTLRASIGKKSQNNPKKEQRGKLQPFGADKSGDKKDGDRPSFNVLVDRLPAVKGKRVCFPNLSADGCPQSEEECAKKNFCHFTPKKESLDEPWRLAFAHYYGPLKFELA